MDFSDLVCNIYGCVGSIPGGKKKKWCQVLTSHNYKIELPSDILAFAYYPYGALGRKENFWYKNISRFKRGGKDGEEQKKAKERIDEGRDGRELHDNDDGISQNVQV
jgi:hypothetical protein